MSQSFNIALYISTKTREYIIIIHYQCQKRDKKKERKVHSYHVEDETLEEVASEAEGVFEVQEIVGLGVWQEVDLVHQSVSHQVSHYSQVDGLENTCSDDTMLRPLSNLN